MAYIKKGGWGGGGRGAGRKSISKVDRLLIGARCQNEWDALKESGSSDGNRSADIHENRSVLNAVPLEEDPPSEKVTARMIVLRRAGSPEKIAADQEVLSTPIADAVEALRDLGVILDGIDPEGSDYVRKISFKIPQGKRKALIAHVADEESTKRGVPITERQIERWWDDYRAFCKRRRQDEQNLISGKGTVASLQS